MSSRATPAVRIGKLERDLAVLDHRLGDVERLNRDVPPGSLGWNSSSST